MLRFAAGTLLCLAVMQATVRADQNGQAKTPREQFQALAKEYNDAYDAYYKGRAAAKTPQEKAKLRYPDFRGYAVKMLELAKANPKDEASFDALVWSIHKRGPKEAVAILARDHAGNARLDEVLHQLIYWPSPEAEQLFAAVAKNGKDDRAKARAALEHGSYLQKKADAVAFLKNPGGGNVEATVTYEHGKDFANQLRTLDVAAILKDADTTLDQGIATLRKQQGLDRKDRLAIQNAEGLLKEIRTRSIGMPVPEIAAEDIDGQAFKLSDYKGKVVMLDFWGHW